MVLVFLVLAAIVALRRRESILDAVEFEGSASFQRARLVMLVLIALAFLALVVINNW
jgi:hypothetical protein